MTLSAVLPMVMLLVVLIPENCHSDHLRKPWITKQPATVLDLQCEVPWKAVKGAYRLDIGFGEPTSDESVYAFYLLSPGHEQLIITGLKKHTMAEASNTTAQNGPVLSIRMPTNDDEGQYFCLVHYDTGNISIYSVNVGRRFFNEPREQWNGSFSVRASPADNVTVTWYIIAPKPVSIEIERVHVGLRNDRSGTIYSKLIVSANNDNVLHRESGTLLAKVLSTPYQPHNNYTVSIYVQSEFCFPNCSYGCRSVTPCSESDDAICRCEGMIEPNVVCGTCNHIVYQGVIGGIVPLSLLLNCALIIFVCKQHNGNMCGFRLFKKTLCCPRETELHISTDLDPSGSEQTMRGPTVVSEAASGQAPLQDNVDEMVNVRPERQTAHMAAENPTNADANSREQETNDEHSAASQPFLCPNDTDRT